MKKILGLILALTVWAGTGRAANEHMHEGMSPGTRNFMVVAIEYEGTKVWVPGTLVVKKGDTVKIKLINNIKSDPSSHGYAIDAFGVKAVVTRGKQEMVTFTADKEGFFDVYCQLHPAHIGGQVLVLP